MKKKIGGIGKQREDRGRGGRGRNRTGDEGFAGPCITTLLPSPI